MPNTKTKKFDWQIFLAVYCILLVICCATVCCVIGNTEKGVANAYYPSQDGNSYIGDVDLTLVDSANGINLFNIQVTPYVNNNTSIENAVMVSFDEYFRPLILGDDKVRAFPLYYMIYYSLSSSAEGGGFTNTYGFTYTVPYSQEMNRFNITASASNGERYCYSYDCYFNFSSTIYEDISIDYLSVWCYYTHDNQVYQDGYDAGISNNDVAYNNGYNDGVLVGSQFYKDMTYKEDLYRLNQSTPYESYTRNILDLTDFLTDAFDINQRWYWCTAYTTTSIGGGVLYYPSGTREQFDNIGDVLTFYKENGNAPIYCIYDAGGSALHKFYDFVYIVDGYDFSIMLNDGYALGYQQGLNAGNKATEEQLKHYEQIGYENGKSQGLVIGRQEGYNQGVLDANDYSFFSLFTSVFDAPITAIVGKWGDSDGDGVYQREGGMLNFYIPGLDINFAPFLLSLFTIGIIVLIIRFILARKS